MKLFLWSAIAIYATTYAALPPISIALAHHVASPTSDDHLPDSPKRAHKPCQSRDILTNAPSSQTPRRQPLRAQARQHRHCIQRQLLDAIALRALRALELLDHCFGDFALQGRGRGAGFWVRVVGRVAGGGEEGLGVDVGCEGEDIVEGDGEEGVVQGGGRHCWGVVW